MEIVGVCASLNVARISLTSVGKNKDDRPSSRMPRPTHPKKKILSVLNKKIPHMISKVKFKLVPLKFSKL